MGEVVELLCSLNREVLTALARKLGLPKTVTHKADLVNELDRYVSEKLRDLVNHCSDAEKKLLAEAAHNDGHVDPHGFQAKYGVACPVPSNPGYRCADASPLLVLIGHEYNRRQLPAPVAKRLRAILEKPPEAGVKVVGNIPPVYLPPQNWRKQAERAIHVHEAEPIVFPELRSVLRLVQAGKLKVTDKGHRPTEETVRLVSEVLVVPDFLLEPPPEKTTQHTERGGAIRGHAWVVLVQQCGWAKARGGRLSLTDEGRNLLLGMKATDFGAGAEAFVYDDEFDEFNRINHIRGQSGGGRRYLTSPGERRSSICESMAKWPMNQWISFDEAARFLLASGCAFSVTEADHTLYFGELQYGMLGNGGAQINRQYLRACLFESLATLGLIDVAYVYPHDLWPELGDSWGIDDLSFCSRYDGLLYVRLNALGAYCLGATESYQPASAPGPRVLRVLPTREVALVDGPLPAADRHMLAMFATEKSEYVWELDRARILDHVESGGTVEDALRFLEEKCADPLPETVQVMLSDLARRVAAVRGVEEALLVELADEPTAALIAHDAQAGKHCWLAGGRRLAVPKRNRGAFRNAVKKLGFIIPDGQLPV
jgi:hypothetical protein